MQIVLKVNDIKDDVIRKLNNSRYNTDTPEDVLDVLRKLGFICRQNNAKSVILTYEEYKLYSYWL